MPTTPTQPRPITAADLAAARALVDVTAARHYHPATIGGAWMLMKSARGQTFHAERLHPAHIVQGEALPDCLDSIQARALDRIRRRIAFRASILGDNSDQGGNAA